MYHEHKLYPGYLMRYSQNDCKKVPVSQAMTFSLEDSTLLNKISFPPQKKKKEPGCMCKQIKKQQSSHVLSARLT
jgi:hypothetical protein